MTNASRPRRQKRAPGPPTKAMRRLMRDAVKRGGTIDMMGVVTDEAQGRMVQSLLDRNLAEWSRDRGLIITETGRTVGQEKP